jgi:four helix bundle protein
MSEDLIIVNKTYDLLAWLLPKAEQFPKAYRFSLTQRMLDAALDVQDKLSQAQSHRDSERIRALHDADAALNRLRVYLRLAHQWGWFSDGQYHHVSEKVAEIGRMLGGWLQHSERPPVAAGQKKRGK